MSTSLLDILTNSFGEWREVAEQTIRGLGAERARLFVDLYNDALDLLAPDPYPREEWSASLVHHDLTGLFKELQGFHVLFLCGNYPQVQRNLRFTWEMMFRAYHADTHAAGQGVAEKIVWLAEREEQLNWKSVMQPTLEAVLPPADHALIEGHYHPLWRRLSGCVHPSADLRLRMVGESMLHVVDDFDEQWAGETLEAAAEVFDLVWLVVLTGFSKCLPLLTGPRTFRRTPRAHTLVTRSRVA